MVIFASPTMEQGPAAVVWIPLGCPVPPGVGDLLTAAHARHLKVPFYGKTYFVVVVYLVPFGLWYSGFYLRLECRMG